MKRPLSILKRSFPFDTASTLPRFFLKNFVFSFLVEEAMDFIIIDNKWSADFYAFTGHIVSGMLGRYIVAITLETS